MNTSTHSLAIAVPKEKAFAKLSDIGNLPRWATVFCRELKRLAGGKYTVVTPAGEMALRVDAVAKTGVIDMYSGPSEDRMLHWPARVVGLPDARSLFLFTALQYPGVDDVQFEAQCAGLEEELPHILAMLESEAVVGRAA